jgi:hypothetical protein
LPGLLFDPEEMGSMFLQSDKGILLNYTALRPRRYYSSLCLLFLMLVLNSFLILMKFLQEEKSPYMKMLTRSLCSGEGYEAKCRMNKCLKIAGSPLELEISLIGVIL